MRSRILNQNMIDFTVMEYNNLKFYEDKMKMNRQSNILKNKKPNREEIKMSKTKKVYSVILFLSILVACETYTTKKVQITPPFNHSFIRSVAVIEFSDSSGRKGAG